MVQAPEDMRLWLKFDSHNLAVNSAGRMNTISIHGKPGNMPPDRGIYRNWGAFFDLGDSIEIAGGLDHKGNRDPKEPQLEWTITFWTIYPAVYGKDATRTLVQAYDGRGAYIQLNEHGHIVAIDELDERNVVDSGIDLSQSKNKKANKRWTHIAAVCKLY